MAKVDINKVNKIFDITTPVKKKWYEIWKSSVQKCSMHVVKDVTINIQDGEFMVLVGPSGCGKTTTLRMVAGLEEITEGEIYIGERLVNDLSPKDRDIAMVFQNYALYPHMNVYENMAFGLRLRRFPREEIEQRVQEAAKLLGLEQLLYRKPGELSGGQRQRVAMGRAIVRRPKVYLMDEPLSNLDAKLRVQMRAELQKLHRRLGVTTIYVTHDQTEAMTLGDRLVLMKDGVVQQIGTPLEIYEMPKNQYVAGFIGSPAMNFINCGLETINGDLYIKAAGFAAKVPESKKASFLKSKSKEFILGIRPEDLYDKMFARLATPENTIEAGVEIVEPVGSEVYLHLNCAGDFIIARVDSHTQAQVGQKMEIVLDLEKMHIFDKESKLNLLLS
jgi:multiple sugar transport system ATP-binding protein